MKPITPKIIQLAIEVERSNYPIKMFARDFGVDYHELIKRKNKEKRRIKKNESARKETK